MFFFATTLEYGPTLSCIIIRSYLCFSLIIISFKGKFWEWTNTYNSSLLFFYIQLCSSFIILFVLHQILQTELISWNFFRKLSEKVALEWSKISPRIQFLFVEISLSYGICLSYFPQKSFFLANEHRPKARSFQLDSILFTRTNSLQPLNFSNSAHSTTNR